MDLHDSNKRGIKVVGLGFLEEMLESEGSKRRQTEQKEDKNEVKMSKK